VPKRQIRGGFESAPKLGYIGHPVISGEHDHRGFTIAAHYFQRRQTDTGRSVFAHGLSEKIVFRQITQFAAQRGDLICDRDNESLFSPAEGVNARGGFFDQALAAKNFKQLLGSSGAAQRPKPRAFAAGDDHAKTFFRHQVVLVDEIARYSTVVGITDQAMASVTKSWTVPATRAQIRVDAFARECLPHLSRREIDGAIRDRLFSVNNRVTRKGDRLGAGDTLVFNGPEAWLAVNPPPNSELEVRVVYEDSSTLIVDKPAGMPTHGFSGRDTDTLANFIASKYPEVLAVGKNRWEPGIVHRLDRETSGLVLIAKTQTAFVNLCRQFRRRDVTKIYRALVWGLTDPEGRIELPLAHDVHDKRRMRAVTGSEGSKNQRVWNAATRYRRIGQAPGLSLLEIDMDTGVTHQIRVHLAAIGHPIVADALYGAEHSDILGLQRHFLHAYRLVFRHPEDGRIVAVETELSDELREGLGRVGIQL
jgi:23S rRNA pseudouridine1911/1915/1917 synthase